MYCNGSGKMMPSVDSRSSSNLAQTRHDTRFNKFCLRVAHIQNKRPRGKMPFRCYPSTTYTIAKRDNWRTQIRESDLKEIENFKVKATVNTIAKTKMSASLKSPTIVAILSTFSTSSSDYIWHVWVLSGDLYLVGQAEIV